jgi:hypothetical protein
MNKLKTDLIPDLELAIDGLTEANTELISQRDRALEDVASFRQLSMDALQDVDELKRELDSAYSALDVVYATLGGLGGGVILTLGAIALGALFI